MIGVNIKLAIASLKSSKLRAFLTMFAVIIGVMGFVIITTTVEGLKSSVSQEIGDLGGNLVTVNSGKLISVDEEGNRSINFAASFGAPTLTQKDYEAIKDLDGIEAFATQAVITGNVNRNDKDLQGAFIVGTTEDYPKVLNQAVEAGSFFADEDEGKFAVIGSGVTEDLYGGSFIPGTTISIRGVDFTVIGQLEKYEAAFASFGGIDINKAVLIPIKHVQEVTGAPLAFVEFDIQLADTSDAEAFSQRVEQVILENHNGEDDFTVLKEDELIELTSDLFDVIKSAAQALSYIMIFVGGVVILLIMLITVTERTKEIGIRKSIGATNGNILVQFLTEAVVISWIGSVLGIVMAFLLGLLVRAQAGIAPEYSLGTLIAVVIIATIIGAIAGLYPAWQAARKDPVEALRHE